MKPAETYILNQPEPYQSMLLHLQLLIEHVLPAVDLEYKWGMPCYYLNKRPICYLNHRKDYVDVGFWHTAHLEEKWQAYLVSENRKVVKSLRYKTLGEIEDKTFMAILKAVASFENTSFLK